MPTISPQTVSVIKTLGVLIIFTVLTFFADASHLSGIVSAPVAGLIAALASWAETDMKQGTDKALFGMVRVSSLPS